MMKTNVTLIGMPGSGKSTVGIILAKNLSFGFIDTDVLIQINRQKSLQQILDQKGYLELRRIEKEEILKINIRNHVISTGGSAVYSPDAMAHLSVISTIVFLEVDFETSRKRIHNFDSRGIAKAKDQTFLDLFHERQALYKRYAEITVDCNIRNQEEIAEEIAGMLRNL